MPSSTRLPQNGTVTPYDLGIAPDDFAFIPTNQDLYICEVSNRRILKLSSTFLSNYVGDLLIVQEEEPSDPPGLVIVNWTGTNFISRFISASAFNSGHVEDAAFAPLDLPSKPLQ